MSSVGMSEHLVCWCAKKGVQGYGAVEMLRVLHLSGWETSLGSFFSLFSIVTTGGACDYYYQ